MITIMTRPDGAAHPDMLGTVITVSDWLAVFGAVGGAVGAVGGLGGSMIAFFAKRDSRQSAEASSRSADEAAALRKIELDRQHHALRPPPPSKIDLKLRDGALFGSISVPLDYRVKAIAFSSVAGSHEIGLPLLLRANQPQLFQIEPWPPGSKTPKTREIRFRFWSPQESDDTEVWSCRCGRPSDQGMAGPGHWEWQLPVEWKRPNLRFM